LASASSIIQQRLLLVDQVANPPAVNVGDARATGRDDAEPKLDGQRAQLHVHDGKAVACYSRRGLDLLEHAGMGVTQGHQVAL